MFLAEREYNKLPSKIKKEINLLHLKDRLIYEANKKNKNINFAVIDYVINSIYVYLRYHKKVNKKIRSILEESLGQIPITFFDLDRLKVDKEVIEKINPLLDTINSHALKTLNRESIIKSVLRNLIKLKGKYKKEDYSGLKISFPDFSKGKYFNKKDLFLIGVKDPKIKKSIVHLKKKISSYKQDYYNIVKLSKKHKNVDKETTIFFLNILEIYSETKNRFLQKRYLNNLLSELAFLFYYKKINLSRELKEAIYEFIDMDYVEDCDSFIQKKLKQLKKIKKKCE